MKSVDLGLFPWSFYSAFSHIERFPVPAGRSGGDVSCSAAGTISARGAIALGSAKLRVPPCS